MKNMANKRTVYSIPANTWVKVVNGKMAARIFKSNVSPTYYSMLYDDAVSTPVDGTIPATAEKMFMDGNVEVLSDSVVVYLWVACAEDQTGTVVVTV